MPVPGRSSTRSCSTPPSIPSRRPPQRILRAEHDWLDPAWVERTFADINLLVLEGDAAALAKHVSELSDARVTRAAGDGARVVP